MSVTHRSISVAQETIFGSLVNGLPSYSGLTFTSIPCERDPIIIYGEVVASERNDARDGTYSLPPEPDTVWSSGSRVRRRTGQVVIRLDLTTAAGASSYASNYLGRLLGAGSRLRAAQHLPIQLRLRLTSTPLHRQRRALITSAVASSA